MGTQHTIELNGKRYDTLTGRQVANTPSSPSSAPKQVPKSATRLDGFARRRPHSVRKTVGTSKPHHVVQKAKTLMRQSVQKPVTPVSSPVEHLKQPAGQPALKVKTHPTTSHARLKRSAAIPQSSMIKRFTDNVTAAAHHHVKTPSLVQAVSTSVEEVLTPMQNAIEAATSHTQTRHRRVKTTHRVAKKLRITPRALNASLLSVAVLLCMGYFGYQSVPNLAMRVASMRANVHGSLPHYKPAGFSLNGAIRYQPGEIIVAYKSNSDDRSYAITQKTSSWDSEALRQNYVASKNTPYQTIQDKGKTIYMYDNSEATWVDGGVWYKIEGNSQMNSQQVLSVVNSF